jgi:small-conductance mechanosensitive channel
MEDFLKLAADVWNLKLYDSGGQEVHLNQVVIALGLIVIGIFIGKRVAVIVGKRLIKVSKVNNNTAHFVQRVLFYFFVTIIVLLALPIAGIPITIFAVMGSAVAIGLGFGAQNLFNNLISGIIIMLEKPIRIGDVIEVSGEEGRVEDIGNRCVRVRRTDGIDLIVPNSKFLEDIVVNWTLLDGNIRGIVTVGVAYGSDTAKVKELMLQAAAEHEKVLKTPEVVVIFDDFGDNSLVFNLIFWSEVSRPMDLKKLKSDIRFRIDDLFKEADLVIAFPQRDIHLDTLKPLEIRLQQ